MTSKRHTGGRQTGNVISRAFGCTDIDLAAHDRLGEHTLEITKELLREETIDLKFAAARFLILQVTPAK